MRVLMIGDAVGRPGREAISSILPGLRDELKLDFVVANGENSAGGVGITPKTMDELLSSGVDVITTGNHVWDKVDIVPVFEQGSEQVLRPMNYPPTTPGKGYTFLRGVLVVNLIGRVFVGTFDCPFRAVDKILSEMTECPKAILVDFHAEATSEKKAMGWYLDGKVSAVVGTHTHVPTADTRILPGGTAYVTDLGMCGALNSVIGVEVDEVLTRFLHQTPSRLKVATSGPMGFNSVLMEIDETTGKATYISREDRQLV